MNMGRDTKIEWTDRTLNFWHGCTEVSPGCDNCYARTLSERFKRQIWGTDKPRHIIKSAWDNALKWQREAEKSGQVISVFWQSMSDLFELFNDNQQREKLNDLRFRVFHELIPQTPNLRWLMLTKRVGNVKKMVPTEWLERGFPSNVWLGISVVNQEEADRDIPKLLQLPVKRFLSCEPLLGAIDLNKRFEIGDSFINALTGVASSIESTPYQSSHKIHWVIVGGESGSNARPMHPEWALSLRDRCAVARVPFFFKQWGAWVPSLSTQVKKEWVLHKSMELIRYTTADSTRRADIGKASYHAIPSHVTMGDGDQWVTVPILERVGKSEAGNLLDGEVCQQFPF